MGEKEREGRCDEVEGEEEEEEGGCLTWKCIWRSSSSTAVLKYLREMLQKQTERAALSPHKSSRSCGDFFCREMKELYLQGSGG